MKKTILSTIVAFTISISSFSQNVNIPDANFKAYLVGNSFINTNSDTEIQVSEANSYSDMIFCSSLNITDLTGIEEFTSMTILWCSDNQITSLDVSNCASLTSITCGNNQLTSLIVNSGLKYLTCESNQLTSLNLTANVGLEQLLCSSNSISTLDLSNNPLLTMLSCQNNLLTSLNVANGNNINMPTFIANGNSSLTCIQVDNAYWSSTNWINIDPQTEFSLDCSGSFGCTVTIPNANFKTYLVGNSAINTNGDSEIQCSEATSFSGVINCSGLGINNMTGIEAFTSITELICHLNQITNINVSFNDNLTKLWCQNNLLTSLDVSNNINLFDFVCSSNQISSLNVSSMTNLSNFGCQNNNLTSIDVSSNTALVEFSCNNNQLTNLNVASNVALTKLWCYNNLLTSIDLSTNTSLILLQCQNNQLTNLNVANGNNLNVLNFNATNNPNLTCIKVDDAAYSTTNWTNIDATASFSENCASSIHENEQLNITLYPNPTSSNITIESDEKINQIQIFNILGELVQTETMNSFSVNELSEGVYLIKINTTNRIITTRFIKE